MLLLESLTKVKWVLLCQLSLSIYLRIMWALKKL